MTTTAEILDPVDLSVDPEDQSTIVFTTDDSTIVSNSDDDKIPLESNEVPPEQKQVPPELVPQEQKEVPPELVLPEQNNASKSAAEDANKNALGASTGPVNQTILPKPPANVASAFPHVQSPVAYVTQTASAVTTNALLGQVAAANDASTIIARSLFAKALANRKALASRKQAPTAASSSKQYWNHCNFGQHTTRRRWG